MTSAELVNALRGQKSVLCVWMKGEMTLDGSSNAEIVQNGNKLICRSPELNPKAYISNDTGQSIFGRSLFWRKSFVN